MTRSDPAFCLADFTDLEILGLFDRADELERGAPRRLPPDVDPDAAPARLSADTLAVLAALDRLRSSGHSLEEIRVAWIGAASPRLHAWMEGAGSLGFHLTMAIPDGYEPDAGLFLACESRAPGRIRLVRDPSVARADADVVLEAGDPPADAPEPRPALTLALDEVRAERGRSRTDFRALIEAAPSDETGESPGGYDAGGPLG